MATVIDMGPMGRWMKKDKRGRHGLFGWLLDDMLERMSFHELSGKIPEQVHILGEPVYGLMGNRIGCYKHVLDLMRCGHRLETMAASTTLLSAEREAFLLLKEIRR